MTKYEDWTHRDLAKLCRDLHEDIEFYGSMARRACGLAGLELGLRWLHDRSHDLKDIPDSVSFYVDGHTGKVTVRDREKRITLDTIDATVLACTIITSNVLHGRGPLVENIAEEVGTTLTEGYQRAARMSNEKPS